MKTKKRKLLKIVCSVIIILVVGAFLANWYMKNRLERLLREQLTERISTATGGFYRFQTQELEIGLFNGELTLEGVDFKPDSVVFRQWASKDSLPQKYFEVQIQKIHFKGLNLIWLLSYKELHFDLFEIQTPVVKVFDSGNLSKVENRSKNQSSKTLYEMISPYIDVIGVKKMNLEHASITYVANDQGAPAIYGLKDVSFHAYGFVLDKNSSQSGKLLLCDNFDFTTNQPQVLLSNNQFLLETDNILLNTKDSIIQIDKVHLQPQTILWEQQHAKPDTYLETKIKSIKVKGVHFKRENGFNYLEATAFDISKSEIQYFNIKRDSLKVEAKPKIKTEAVQDTLNLSWTLYAIVSPILHSISIDKIGIDEAKLRYTNSSDKGIDVYNLNKFNFEAYGFKVDSLADIQQRFLYSQGFAIDATTIQGVAISQNHAMSIGRMKLNTVTKDFQIKDVNVWAISLKSKRDYMSGTIDSISLSGLEYENGLKAERLSIDAPKIEYVRMQKTRQKEIVEANSKSVNLDAVTPFFDHISINQVNLNSGNITFTDKMNKDNNVYKLPRINFSATNFLINEATLQHSLTYFAYDDIRFSFEQFDNFLPGKQYRLMIKKGVYTGIGGNLELRDVRLIPQNESGSKASDIYVSLLTPFMAVRHIDYKISPTGNTLMFNSLNIEAPRIRITKVRDAHHTVKKETPSSDKPLNFIAGVFDITDGDIVYSDRTTKDSLKTQFNDLQLKSLSWDAEMKKTSIGSIMLQSPNIHYRKRQEAEQGGNNAIPPGSFARSLEIGQIGIVNAKVGVNQPSLKLNFETPNIDIRTIKWSNKQFSLTSVNIAKPEVKINQISSTDKIANKPSSDKQNLYSALDKIANEISITKFNVDDANIDYASTLNGKLNRQQRFNTARLSFSDLIINSNLKTFTLGDIEFSTRNFRFPLNNGFYTLQAEAIELKKTGNSLKIDNLHLVPAYPKQEFAYHHPTNRDWFDVKVGNVLLSGIDFSRYFANDVLHAGGLFVKDVELLNFKNQQIEIQHNIMPMIYEGLQKLPVKFVIDTANVENFKVVYEELPKTGTTSGVIFFTNMNGRLSGLTNIVSKPNQYIQLDADGNLMGSGYFTATWMLPVDSLNDHFYLQAKLNEFDMKDLNQLITPMAPAQIEEGHIKSLTFSTDASTTGATIDMLMLYNDLNISVLKNKDGESTVNSLFSTIANKVIKKNNPDKEDKKPRHVNITIKRDAYHSTFNYLWQILQPAVVESVGFSQSKQNFAKKVSGFFKKVSGFLKESKKENKKEVKEHPAESQTK